MPNKQNIPLSACAWHSRQVTKDDDYLQSPEKAGTGKGTGVGD